jgi:hypothetical protein
LQRLDSFAADLLLLDTTLEYLDGFQCRIPARLQFIRDETVGRIARVVLLPGALRGVASRFVLEPRRFEKPVMLLRVLTSGLDRGFDRPWLDGT